MAGGHHFVHVILSGKGSNKRSQPVTAFVLARSVDRTPSECILVFPLARVTCRFEVMDYVTRVCITLLIKQTSALT